MEFVVEDPQRTGGITTYHPARYDYDGSTEMWVLLLVDGDRDVKRRIPRERIIYIESEADSTGDAVTDR